MEGCSAPLVVKFADTQKDKEQKKMQQFQTSLYTTIGVSSGNTTNVPCAGTLPASILNGTGITSGLTNSGSLGTMNGLSSIVNGTNTNGSHSAASALNLNGPQATALGQNATSLASAAPLMTNPPQQVNPFIGADAISSTSLQLLQQLQAVGLQQQLLQGLGILNFYFIKCFFFLCSSLL